MANILHRFDIGETGEHEIIALDRFLVNVLIVNERQFEANAKAIAEQYYAALAGRPLTISKRPTRLTLEAGDILCWHSMQGNSGTVIAERTESTE